MKTFITIAACLLSLSCFSQTKLIAFRSHSGNNTNFRAAIERNMFDIGNSNFGLPSYRTVRKIDTVELINNHEIVLSIKFDTYDYSTNKKQSTYYRKLTVTKETDHRLFSAKSIDSLKAGIHLLVMEVPLDSAVFLGFDKQFKQANSIKKQPKRK